jgi:peptidoglycan/LPS O-acetylase OafA/YrhL
MPLIRFQSFSRRESSSVLEHCAFIDPNWTPLGSLLFLAVLFHHGPGPQGSKFLWLVCSAGGFGLSMFFLLSAYLITELLIREHEQTENIAWGLFFVRRALRIWPLYYAAIVIAFVIGRILPNSYRVSQTAIAVMVLFVANCTKLAPGLGILVGPLWSISIEEQFYFIWPPILKFGGKQLALIASILIVIVACIWLWVFSEKGWLLWYDTPVEFFFFAVGAIIALATRGKPLCRMNTLTRYGLLTAGLLILLSTAHFGYVGPVYVAGVPRTSLYTKYFGGAAGCVLIFFAVLGMSNIPRLLIHFGKISYGLYVFHIGMLKLSAWITSPLRLDPHSAGNVFMVDSVALISSIFVAHFSYQYFERPFIKLKERFSVIQSRPA